MSNCVEAKKNEVCKLKKLVEKSNNVGSEDIENQKKPYKAKREYMSRVRNKFQTRVLELGYSFVFTDVDIVWFGNPLLRVPVGADVAISCDQFYGDNPYDVWKNANGGFPYARPSARTVAFFKGWYEARRAHPGQHDNFCQHKKDFRQLCTFHGNCLKGLPMKLGLLRSLLDERKQFKIAGPRGGSTNSTVSE
ncbi:hypothetical protein VPH35_098621 [Triticum aestivum]|uniref:Nucleotide-diphospho-sugar transferase domain-containing protein n=1 Tax=Aegilops tauschii TaxID=37682 RepID=R7W1C2_AEGTA|nr:uncharacterized protein At4g15970-like [Aegilops tauschii subsp. strangulata]